MFTYRFLPLITIFSLFNSPTYTMQSSLARAAAASRTHLLAPRTLATQNILRNRLAVTRSFSSQSDGGGGGFLLWAVGMIGGTMYFLKVQNDKRFPITKDRPPLWVVEANIDAQKGPSGPRNPLGRRF